MVTFGNREYLHSTKSSERPQGIQRAHTHKNWTIWHQPDYTIDTTEGGLHAHTPETRTPENKRITTFSVSTNHPLPYKQTRHIGLPSLDSFTFVKMFFSPVEIPNVPNHVRTHRHTHTSACTHWKPEAKTPHWEQQPEEKPEDVEHTNPQTMHPNPYWKP